ncbi:MAG: head-tail adaptor protein [Bacteroides xylanisolvens]
MRAGELREKLEFYELQTVENPVTGSRKEKYVFLLYARAAKRRLTAVVNPDGISASEKFIGNIIVFQVRYNPRIKENQRIVYENQKYDIKLLDRQGNSYIITLHKVN